MSQIDLVVADSLSSLLLLRSASRAEESLPYLNVANVSVASNSRLRQCPLRLPKNNRLGGLANHLSPWSSKQLTSLLSSALRDRLDRQP